MGHSHSSRAEGIWLAVGVFAMLLAVAECVAAVMLANRPAIAAAVGLPEWGVIGVTIGAASVILLLVVSMLIGVIPRGALHWDAPRSKPAGQWR
jgi:hypothetical protein